MSKKAPFALRAVVCLIAASLAPAQETRGSIIGRVVDASGAIIPGVTIHAVNLATNVSISGESNAEGNFEIPYLLPGEYRITAEQTGFKSFRRDGVEVRIGERVSIPIRMELGQVSEQITVTAETPLLESAGANLGQVIDQRRIAELPIAHGNPFLLMTLSPGVSYTQNPGLDRPFEPTHIVGYAMGGVRANRSEITLDGAPNTALNHRWGAGDLMAGYTPPSDVVHEFKVQTATFDASIGHTQGGVTSVTLKSGGNSLHGTAYYSLLNPVLNANLFFANSAGQPKGHFIYNRWGTSATGPVYIPKLYNGKDRTFFTYGYEGIHESRAMGAAYGAGTLTVPTARQREGDFSELLAVGSRYQIYDPATRVALGTGRYQSQPFPNNIIPSNRINPIARNILNYYSLPNVPGTADGTNNLIRVNDPEVIKYFNHIGRVDHNIGANNRMFVRFNTYKRFSHSSDWFRSAPTGGYSDWKQHSFSIDDVHNLSATTFMNVRYSFFRLSIYQYPQPASIGFDLASLGFPRSYTDAIDPGVRAFPAISISGYSGTQNNWWRYPTHNQSLEGNVTSIKGNHTLRFGADARQYRNFQYEPHNASSGIFAFGNTWTLGPFDNSVAAPIGQGLASMLLGLPTSGGVDRKASFAAQSTIVSAYVQDDWRITPKLIVNLGLRYELEGAMTERFNRTVRGYDFSTPSPLEAQVRANYAAHPIAELPANEFRLIGGLTFPGVGSQPRALWNRDTNNIMPRAGFAYTLDQKTVIRGGFGIYFGPLGAQRGDVIQLGFSQRTEFVPTLDNGLTFIADLSNPFPNGIQEPPGAADGLLTYVGRSARFFEESPQAPRQQRWQLGVQRELPQRVLMEVAYLGNYGDSLELTRDLRALPTEYLSRSPFRDNAHINYMTQQVPNPFYPLLPGTGLSGQNVSRSYLLAGPQYSQFTGLTSTSYEGYSWYHAMQVRTERRFAAGWSVNAAYTWSKSMEAIGQLNGYLSPLEYAISTQDRPHRFVISGLWELPFGRGKRLLNAAPTVVDKVVGGWQVQGIYTAQSGPPIGFGNVLYMGDIHDITLPPGERTVARWFNTQGFDRVPANQLSFNYRTFPSRLNDVRADGVNSWDLSVLKNTRIHERVNAQFRGEFLNAFNHPMFNAPNTSPTSTAFGQVTSQRGYPRRIQLMLKLIF
ncbi:MAG: TonB-dependent receptor [Bryobacteraceae bacterium]|nr:TonB-dependent receptor [Bryobacterales bacterium]NUN01966.1 TonB-dependent receptor [Bryobacteraceae bacterium]